MAHYFVWYRPVPPERWAIVYRWCDGDCKQHSSPAFGVCAAVHARNNPARNNPRGIQADLLGHGINAGHIRQMVKTIRHNPNAVSGIVGPNGPGTISDALNNPNCTGQARLMCSHIIKRQRRGNDGE